MERHKILIVDDEKDVLEILEYNFKNENYNVRIASDGEEAIKIAKDFLPDLIILDVMMPKIDGIETCRLLREYPEFQNTIIVFLTARGEDYSVIAGFDVGADDYVNKPIRIRTLLARIKSLLKRKQFVNKKDDTEQIVLGKLTIYFDRRVIQIDSKEIILPKKEFQILALLISKPGKVFTRTAIYDEVWGSNVIVGDRTLDVHIRKLREKIGDDIILTSRGVGFSINPNYK